MWALTTEMFLSDCVGLPVCMDISVKACDSHYFSSIYILWVLELQQSTVFPNTLMRYPSKPAVEGNSLHLNKQVADNFPDSVIIIFLLKNLNFS